MATKVKVGMVDHSGEGCGPSVYFDDVTALTYEAVMGSGGSVDLVTAAMNILTDCGFTRTTASIIQSASNDAAPATVTAQREIAIRVIYKDTVTGRSERFDIPGPAVTFYPGTGTDEIPLSNAIAAAFITVFEANCVSQDGNAVEVTKIYLVGRNN